MLETIQKKSFIDNARQANKLLQALILGCILFWFCGCSVMISTPRQAEIRVQGLNNQTRVDVVTIDDLLESNMEIPISDRYTLMLDFQWLLGSDNSVDSDLAPWLICKYRF